LNSIKRNSFSIVSNKLSKNNMFGVYAIE
jgi:hypothetical protein